MDFWNELKTRAVTNLIGKGRKYSIQPDFSIVCGSADNSWDSIAVVECKQYKNPNYKNFSDALSDYASNRPEAVIFLANYGDFKSSTLSSKLPLIPSDRYELLPLCQPQSASECQLSKSVWDVVRNRAGVSFVDDIATFTLNWGKTPSDLDLHLVFTQPHTHETYSLSYNCNGIQDAEYLEDVIKGYGPELIKINKWHDGVYDLWVHNYSLTPSITQSNANLTTFLKGEQHTFILECPKTGNGEWWHILSINTSSLSIEVINELKNRG